MYINFRSLYFSSYMDTCIAIVMYCQRLFLLFTGEQHFFSGDLYTCNEYLSSQVWWWYGFGSTALQQD